MMFILSSLESNFLLLLIELLSQVLRLRRYGRK